MNLSVFAAYELRKKGSSVWIVRSGPRLPALAVAPAPDHLLLERRPSNFSLKNGQPG